MDAARLLLALTERRVRTPAGEKKYGQPLNSIITKKARPKKLHSLLMQGGFTYRPPADFPKTGVSVAISGHERPVDTKDLTPETIKDYVREHWKELQSNPRAHAGGWYDAAEKRVFLDMAELMPRPEAIEVGTKRNERAVYDLGVGESGEEIDLRGPPYSPEVAAIRKKMGLSLTEPHPRKEG